MLHRVWAVFAFALLLIGPAQAADPARLQALMADRFLGDPNAPVTMIDYSSLSCPHCREFHLTVLPKIQKDYIDTGKVKLIFRDFPWDKPGLMGAQVSRCVAPERYFPILELLFRNQESWAHPGSGETEAALEQTAKLAGLSGSAFKSCIDDKELKEAIAAERKLGETKYSIQATPTFIFDNGADKVEGDKPYDEFRKVIDALLRAKGR